MDMDDDFVGTLELDLSAQDAELVNRAISLGVESRMAASMCVSPRSRHRGLSHTASQISPHA